MNNADNEYKRLLQLILDKGRRKKNRTGTDTFGVFGAQARFNLQEGYPLLTTKKMFTKGIIHELLWFISGDTNIKYLVDNGVNIWNKDCYRKYKTVGFQGAIASDFKCLPTTPNTYLHLSEEEFVARLKIDSVFAEKYGDLGVGSYSSMWRDFPVNEFNELGGKVKGVDQLASVIEKLKNNPDDRRIIVSAWHPYFSERAVLPPCHCFYQFNTEELTEDERVTLCVKKFNDTKQDYEPFFTPESFKKNNPRYIEILDNLETPTRRLNCQILIRSNDLFLGAPFNIASYSLLIELVAQAVNMQAGELVYTVGDLHLYENHLEQAREQLKREPYPLPKLKLNPEVRDLFKFKFEDITIENYQSHPAIKGEMST